PKYFKIRRAPNDPNTMRASASPIPTSAGMWVVSSTGTAGRALGGGSTAARFAAFASRTGLGASIVGALDGWVAGWSAAACAGSLSGGDAVGAMAGGPAGKIAWGDALRLKVPALVGAGGVDGIGTIGGSTAVVALGRAGMT